MIILRNPDEPELKAIEIVPRTPEEEAEYIKSDAEWRRNVQWFGAHAKEIRDAHSGKCIVILGQELFVGDDPREVRARAHAAHPELKGGEYSKYLSIHRGPKVY
jgi:hypothetical protein